MLDVNVLVSCADTMPSRPSAYSTRLKWFLSAAFLARALRVFFTHGAFRIQVLTTIYKEDGVRGLYRGYGPSVAGSKKLNEATPTTA